eukprot:gb/GECH01013706.1/.p1 GENE.gb/GECH01013706.1/~~gb/GECH01013706.1/.p1  ORF type:complete len:500 (+),score=98.39 gb/GECH01013706.1/:1-1500(+)
MKIKMNTSSIFSVVIFIIFFSLFIHQIRADIPVHCVYNDIIGNWLFVKGDNHYNSNINCDKTYVPSSHLKIKLLEPPEAVDEHGNKGLWTMIYDEGFEVFMNGQSYFAFFKYEVNGSNSTSYCQKTSYGYFHEGGIYNPSNWGCFLGYKLDQDGNDISHQSTRTHRAFINDNNNQAKLASFHLYEHQNIIVNHVNQNPHQQLWKADYYPEYNSLTYDQMVQRSGGYSMKPRNWIQDSIQNIAKPSTSSLFESSVFETLPEHLDWRNVSGVNYVTPVRDQGTCGSCYAFASTAMFEARIRVRSLGKKTEIISPQEIVSCSEYSQGCAGGFPYLISKYGQDFAVVPESCFPYQDSNGDQVSCSKQICDSPKRWITEHRYVGGYYGASIEKLMRAEIKENGPIAVSFEVHSDFHNYKGGIYRYSGSDEILEANGYRPWEPTNHVVLIVGWGVSPDDGTKYWIVKNSWGKNWGENGYFRIVRGEDECAIESMPVAAEPVMYRK